MAKITERLSALKVSNLKGPGYFADGGNLYFRVAAGEARGWIFRFMMAGRTRDMGLGGYPEISLAAARKAAAKYRELVNQGIDPIERRCTERGAQRLVAARTMTFDECAREYMADHEKSWRNHKHREQWRTTLARFASPVFGKLPVSAIDDSLVLRVLKPIWQDKPETASRLRGRIESILDWARVNGYRSGENPARWKGHLAHSLPARSKMRRVEHHPALPYPEIGTFMETVRACPNGAARALEFIIVTAARSGEAVGATWDEIDFDTKTWTVPADRMKAGREHRVPLTAPALAILEALRETRTGNFVFAGAKAGRPLSDMAVPMLLRRLHGGDVTVHGFRSTFRDWAAERTSFPNHVVEMALAHAISDAVEAAYRRGDLFDKRRKLMETWAEFCAIASALGDVTPLRRQSFGGATTRLRLPTQ